MQTPYDLVIRGGTMADGKGGMPVEADVALTGDRIVAVGKLPGRGREEIDAKGRLVTPGFVDVHTHYDGQATWDSHLAPSSWHGVTTVVMGNCGVGFAPVRRGDRDRLIELMEGVEDIPGVALHEGLTWNWESFGDYLDALETRQRDIDICAQLPHGALRVYVMGERGAKLEPATENDVATMRRLSADAMRAGALGYINKEPFIGMELLSGETLSTRLERRGPLKVGDAVDIAIHDLAGLGAAHELGIVNRDVKPPNVFLM